MRATLVASMRTLAICAIVSVLACGTAVERRPEAKLYYPGSDVRSSHYHDPDWEPFPEWPGDFIARATADLAAPRGVRIDAVASWYATRLRALGWTARSPAGSTRHWSRAQDGFQLTFLPPETGRTVYRIEFIGSR